MRAPYRVEVFDASTMTCIGMTTIATPTITDDYLTLESSQLVCFERLTGVRMYNLARVLDANGAEIMQGVVYDVQETGQTTTLAIKPLLTLLNRQVLNNYKNAAAPTQVNIPAMIADQFATMYAGSFPSIIKSVATAWVVSTDTQLLNIFGGTTFNLLDVVKGLLTNAGAIVRVLFSPSAKSVSIEVLNGANLPPMAYQMPVVECDTENVLTQTGMLTAMGEAYNACIVVYTVRNAAQTAQTVYTDKDSGMLTLDKSRAQLPVIQTATDLGTFDEGTTITTEQVIAAAREVLQPRAESHEIEITVQDADKLVTLDRESIGKPVRVFLRGVPYDTILTAVQTTGQTKTLTFGYARTALTKQLILERMNAT